MKQATKDQLAACDRQKAVAGPGRSRHIGAASRGLDYVDRAQARAGRVSLQHASSHVDVMSVTSVGMGADTFAR